MWTTWLAYLIAFMGFITFASGALGSVLILSLEDVVPLRYFAMVIALISGGLSMIGVAQGFRLLLLIVRTGEADQRRGVGRPGAGLERLEDRAGLAGRGAQAGLRIDADQLDAGRRRKRHARLVGERHLVEILGDRRRQVAAGGGAGDLLSAARSGVSPRTSASSLRMATR